MKTKKGSLKKNLLGVAILCLMLAGVFYAMQYTRSLDFQSSLAILFNPEADRTWNWCPTNVKTIEVESKQVQGHPEVGPICTIQMESAPEVPEESYKPLLKATGPDRSVVLESTRQMDIFRIEGLPFRSKQLTEYLKTQLKSLE